MHRSPAGKNGTIMNAAGILRMTFACLWRIALCALAYVAGAMISGALLAALGLAFYVLVGLFGMVQSYWLAPTLQVLHNSEMLIDSMVYALALAAPLVRKDETNADELFARYLLCTAQTPVAN